jgi:hypothetical protein
MRLLADENFDNRIVRGLRRVDSSIAIVRVQDTPLYQQNDPKLLEWAAQNGFVLLTHDLKTIPKYAFERVQQNQPMPGIIAVKQDADVGEVIEDLLLLIGAGTSDDLEGQVVYLPL